MVSRLDVLVSGASIAGPALAFWLRRAGHRVTVVERAPKLRGAGQNVDVRGTGREVLRRMGLEGVALAQTTGELGIRFVDDRDVVLAEFPAGQDDSSGATAQLEILRGALSAILVDAGASDVDYEFGEQIAEGAPLKIVKVLDFGVSKSLAGEVADGLATVTGGLEERVAAPGSIRIIDGDACRIDRWMTHDDDCPSTRQCVACAKPKRGEVSISCCLRT